MLLTVPNVDAFAPDKYIVSDPPPAGTFEVAPDARPSAPYIATLPPVKLGNVKVSPALLPYVVPIISNSSSNAVLETSVPSHSRYPAGIFVYAAACGIIEPIGTPSPESPPDNATL